MFRSAGRMGGMEEEEEEAAAADAAAAAAPGGKKRQLTKGRAEFNEDDQAALYNKLQAAQRQGKRGMGKAEVKIAGAWGLGPVCCFTALGQSELACPE